jgi:hypothetical protein
MPHQRGERDDGRHPWLVIWEGWVVVTRSGYGVSSPSPTDVWRARSRGEASGRRSSKRAPWPAGWSVTYSWPPQRPAEGVDMSRKPNLGMQQLPNIELGVTRCLGCGAMVGFPAVLA